MSQQGIEKSIFRVIFRIGFDIRTAMILQNTISKFNLFRIESFDSGECYLGELRTQTTQNRVFRVTFRIGFSIRTAMILQNTISRFNLFRLKVLIPECDTLESHEKKNLFNVAARNKEEHFQSYLSNWL